MIAMPSHHGWALSAMRTSSRSSEKWSAAMMTAASIAKPKIQENQRTVRRAVRCAILPWSALLSITSPHPCLVLGFITRRQRSLCHGRPHLQASTCGGLRGEAIIAHAGTPSAPSGRWPARVWRSCSSPARLLVLVDQLEVDVLERVARLADRQHVGAGCHQSLGGGRSGGYRSVTART